MKRIWISSYTLKPRSSLSSKAAAGERRGALLKIEFDVGVGYADLHPWPELGDESLERQLTRLKQGEMTPYLQRALGIARVDAEARASGVSAFAGLSIPESHWLVTNLDSLDAGDRALDTVAAKWAEGFRSLKIKVGRDLHRELQALNRMAHALTSWRVRLDFNCTFGAKSSTASESGAADWFSALSDDVRSALEFVEDPHVSTSPAWRRFENETSAPLALDRLRTLEELATEEPESLHASWLIVKPAHQEPTLAAEVAKRHDLKICVTSNLDHPLGQVAAALEAAKLSVRLPGRVGTCGLLSQEAYEPSEYSRSLSVRGAHLLPSNEPGLGFGELLGREPWMAL